MLMNYHAKKKGFAKLFIFSSPKSPFPHSHMHICFSFFHKEADQKLATDQCQGRINRDACFGFLSSRFFLSMRALNPLGRQGTKVRVLFLFHFLRSKTEGKLRDRGLE